MIKGMKLKKVEESAVIVIGTHGSGTLMAARVLNLAGCAMPKSVMGSRVLNREKNAWRSPLIKELNSDILASAGSAGNDWRPFPEAWYRSPVVGQYRERARNILQEEFDDGGLFVLEDPQLCRLLPFWVDALKDYGAEPVIVSLVRNPWDVSTSLGMRDQSIDYSIAHLIWLRNVLDSEVHSRTLKRVFINYEALESRPQEFVDRVQKELDICYPKTIDHEAFVEEIQLSFSGYYKGWPNKEDSFYDIRLSDWIRISYRILNRWADDNVMKNDVSRLNTIRSKFDESALVFGRAMAVNEKFVKGAEEIIDRNSERIWQLEEAVGERDRYIRESKEPQSRPTASVRYEQQLNMSESDNYILKSVDVTPVRSPVRLIAFYLPQFHPIPENNKWWGRGFTEWANVTKAMPNYEGHYQPRLPSDMGFYDLRVEEIMEQQAELARQYGIYGFCYHYYWFGGHRLLEMPIERMLKTGKPNIPFCLSWANENWTRTWDGSDSSILISQQHGEEDDIDVIRDLARYIRHPNYIRINGKPLLLIYRVELLPNIAQTVSRWRDFCLANGIGDIYLALICSFEHSVRDYDPKLYGMDAIVEYPPHYAETPIDPPGEIINPKFEGEVHSYPLVVEMYKKKKYPQNITKFRGIIPSWDNTARRQNAGRAYHGSTPELYEEWLKFIMHQTCEYHTGDERIIFINAWNEWAEGAYLEPDRRYGYAYLDATRSAVNKVIAEIERGDGS